MLQTKDLVANVEVSRHSGVGLDIEDFSELLCALAGDDAVAVDEHDDAAAGSGLRIAAESIERQLRRQRADGLHDALLPHNRLGTPI